jgi:DNA-binding response OmpR family regulator
MNDEPLRVLLIEDDPGEARLIRELLRRSTETNYELRHAGSLTDGLTFLHIAPADVVLLDLTLPDSAGLDTLGRFMMAAPGVPVIVQTGLNDDELGRTAIRRGAHDFLLKGRFDGRMLYSSIRYAVDRNALFQRVAGINQSILELERDRVVQDTVNDAVYAMSQPLTILTMVTSEIIRDLQPGDRHYENVQRLCEAADRINRVVRDLSNKRRAVMKTYPGDVQVIDLSRANAVPEPPAVAAAPAPVSAAAPSRPAVQPAPSRPSVQIPPAPRPAAAAAAVAAPPKPVVFSLEGPARMEI